MLLCLWEESEYHQGGCRVYGKSMNATSEAVVSMGRVCIPPGMLQCLLEEYEYHQGGCSVYRMSLNISREAVRSIARVLIPPVRL